MGFGLRVAPRHPALTSVSMIPGATEFAVMPRLPSSLARWAAPLEMLMLRPASRSRFTPSCTMKNGARTFTAKTSSKPSSVSVARSALRPIPALLTMMSTTGSGAWRWIWASNPDHRAAASPRRPSCAWRAKARPPPVRMRSYEGVSIGDPTEAMGIRSGSLYAGFGDKKSLFEEVVEAYGRSPVGGFAGAALREEPTA
nr:MULTISPECIES: TetR/AcrR family transcriptional regulator [Amycolatopsis]